MVLMSAIFAFSATPSDSLPHFGVLNFILKKTGHMIGYALLARAYLWGIGEEKQYSVWLAWGVAILYAATDEFHQSFTSERVASLTDIGIDALGAFLGLLPVIRRRRRLRLLPKL